MDGKIVKDISEFIYERWIEQSLDFNQFDLKRCTKLRGRPILNVNTSFISTIMRTLLITEDLYNFVFDLNTRCYMPFWHGSYILDKAVLFTKSRFIDKLLDVLVIY